MAAALRLARRGAGQTWPNPAVGAILVQGREGDARVVGRAVTAAGGRPHAETIALERAGAEARGATCYVTLEPCSHHARTPPCVDALLQAGIARVVSAASDPDPRVAGRGHQRLSAAGVAVVTGVLAAEAAWHNRGHITRITTHRPYTLLKLAISADGAIGSHGAGQIAITGSAVQGEVHLARAESDAIMVGLGTVLADDPSLTCRIQGLEHRSPVRVVVDTGANIPLRCGLVTTARRTPTWILCGEGADPQRLARLRQAGVSVLPVPIGADRRVDLGAAMRRLGEAGITTILVEGGAVLAEALVRRDLIDLADLYFSPLRIGEGGIPALNTLPLARITGDSRYRRVDDRRIGEDRLHQYQRVA